MPPVLIKPEPGSTPRRVELFQALQAQLLQTPLADRPEQPGSFPTLPFIEAYLSNFIEGTEFELGEAAEIVFGDVVPAERFEDAHDVLGTFELVNDPAAQGADPARPRRPTGAAPRPITR